MLLHKNTCKGLFNTRTCYPDKIPVCVWGGGGGRLTTVLLGWLAASCSIFQRELITRVTMLCSITSA